MAAATFTQQQINDLVNALKTAIGQSTASTRTNPTASTRRLGASGEDRAVQGAVRSIDKLQTRFVGLAKELDILSNANTRLQKMQTTSIHQAGIQSRLAASIATEMQNTATDISTVSKGMPDMFKRAAQETLGGNELFQKIVEKGNIRTAEDFARVAGVMERSISRTQGILSNTIGGLGAIETEIANAQSSNRRADISKSTTKMRDTLIRFEKMMNKAGVSTGKSADEIKKMSLAELRTLSQRVQTERMVDKAGLSMANQYGNFAKRVGSLSANLDKVDKSFARMAKDKMFEKAMGVGKVSSDEIDFLKGAGLSKFGIFMKTLPLMIIRVLGAAGKAIIKETEDIARAAFQTGTAPLADAAFKLRLSAAELQNLTGQFKQGMVGGKSGYKQTLDAITSREKALFRLTGNAKEATELGMRISQFTKIYSSGTRDIGTGIDSTMKHLQRMSVVTGQSPLELQKMLETQMESSEMQEVLLRLSGEQQTMMMEGIKRRREEYAAMGLSAEKATELAAAHEKLKAETVPSRIKQAARLAQVAMMTGMGPQVAREMRMLAVSGRDPQRLAELQMEMSRRLSGMKESAQAVVSASGGAAGLGQQYVVDRMEGMLEGQTAAANKLNMEAIEREKGIGQDRAGIDQRIADVETSAAIQMGEASIRMKETVETFQKNVIGFGMDPVGGVSQFVKAVGSFAGSLLQGAGAAAGTLGGGAAIAAGAGVVGLGAANILKGKGFLGRSGTVAGPGSTPSAGGGGGLAGKAGALFGNIGKSGIGRGLLAAGKGALTAARMATPWGLALTAASIGIPMLFDAFSGTANAATPALPQQNVSGSVDKFMDVQSAQNQQLMQLNQQMQSAVKLLMTGNKHAELTSVSTRDLAEAYIAVEQQNLTHEALYRAQEIRKNITNTSVNPYVRK